jgi:hypothetical protein
MSSTIDQTNRCAVGDTPAMRSTIHHERRDGKMNGAMAKRAMSVERATFQMISMYMASSGLGRIPCSTTA